MDDRDNLRARNLQLRVPLNGRVNTSQRGEEETEEADEGLEVQTEPSHQHNVQV